VREDRCRILGGSCACRMKGRSEFFVTFGLIGNIGVIIIVVSYLSVTSF